MSYATRLLLVGRLDSPFSPAIVSLQHSPARYGTQPFREPHARLPRIPLYIILDDDPILPERWKPPRLRQRALQGRGENLSAGSLARGPAQA